jgi:hypothetical protein
MNYLVLGLGYDKPEVHCLTAAQQAIYNTRMSVALGSPRAERECLRITFGIEGRVAVSVNPEAMIMLATNFKGPHETLVRGLAAALATGAAFAEDPSHRTRLTVIRRGFGVDGGDEKVPGKPTKPRPSGPTKVSNLDRLLSSEQEVLAIESRQR